MFICSEAFSAVVILQCVEWSEESASSTVLKAGNIGTRKYWDGFIYAPVQKLSMTA
jgi:hypothetical protein